ncbi:MAG: M20/M25/M40 family metallo-hydrolase, partial [Armatimonadota bacterium]|nr:M20/M25/M40 family metallo-hydrolase [Armatimonadota bacterium]
AVIGAQFGATVEVRDGYPGWEPNPDSRLLRVAEAVYRRVYGKPPEVQVVHAGLECGVIVSKIPGMEAISFGPLIRGAHTPEEYVDASTVEGTWKLLTTLLDALSRSASEQS